MTPTFETHILGILADPITFGPCLTWFARHSPEAFPLFEMRVIEEGTILSPEEIKAREVEIESKVGFSADEARDLYKRSRADPDYQNIINRYMAHSRAQQSHIVIEEQS